VHLFLSISHSQTSDFHSFYSWLEATSAIVTQTNQSNSLSYNWVINSPNLTQLSYQLVFSTYTAVRVICSGQFSLSRRQQPLLCSDLDSSMSTDATSTSWRYRPESLHADCISILSAQIKGPRSYFPRGPSGGLGDQGARTCPLASPLHARLTFKNILLSFPPPCSL